MKAPKVSLAELNRMPKSQFLAALDGLFEHTPWVTRRIVGWRPFLSLQSMHSTMMEMVYESAIVEKMALIRAHPDLVGKLAKEGKLTRESTAEQQAAGLMNLSAAEVGLFERYNAAYHEKFDFPFVICARENKKEAILAAFPVRLKHTHEEEIYEALGEIGQIAWLRLLDRVSE